MTQLRISCKAAEQVIVPLTSADYWGADLKGYNNDGYQFYGGIVDNP